jgi:predicted dehydrogenase
MDTLRCAVFGAGFWSTFQIPAWLEIEGVELVALYNRTRVKAEKLAAQYGIPHVYDDPEAVFRNEQFDFVDIITHEVTHAPMVAMAARYQKPVICQKPMAPDYPTCVAMVETCRAAGVPFMIHENFRWQRPIRAAKAAVESGRIGRPYRGRIVLSHGTLEIVQNQPYLKELEHWALTDMGSHALDIARYFFGEAQTLFCQTYKSGRWAGARGEDIVTVVLRMGDVICNVDLGWVDNPLLLIEGTHGTLELRADDTLRVTTAAGVHAEKVTYPTYAWADPAYGACHPSIVDCNADLLRAIRTGQPSATDAADNLKTMRLVYAAYDSAERNESIRLD